MTESPQTSRLKEIAAAWREARRIYPIYTAVISRFELPLKSCHHLDSPVDRADDDATKQVREWLESVDEKIEAAQLRQVLQTTTLATEESMQSLAQRYLAKNDAAEAYRDRIEFLLSQYFSQKATAGAARGIVSHDEIAKSLEPVIGSKKDGSPAWVKELDVLLARLEKFRSLRDFLTGGVLEQGRVLKSRNSSEFVQASVLASITRYNFLVRLNFIRLLHNDLERIQRVTRDLVSRGVKGIDCSAAGLSNNASPDEVLKFAANWKAIFRKDYSERQVATAVVKVLDACEKKLRETPESVKVAPLEPPETKEQARPNEVLAAAAAPEVPEFDISKPLPAIAMPPKAVGAVASAKAPVAATVTPAAIRNAEQQISKQQAPAPAKPRFAMYEVQEMIANQLAAANLQKTHLAVAAAQVGECKVTLSSWEVTAFIKEGSDSSELLQQAVVARAIVSEVVGRKKSGAAVPDLKSATVLGRAEAARLQEAIAQARDAKNIDAAVNLAATQKRLLQILEEANKLQES
ncbi:MAG: hypothetical protein ROO76_20965 [Terriglobia bacterium]|jgi:hypothetical protein|nr:hypothetical protein [Terriglobia bacterium]